MGPDDMKTNKLLGVTAAACFAIIGFAGCAALSTSENTNRGNGDEAISAKVRASVSADASLQGDAIVVTTTDGNVALSGNVVTSEDMRRAVALARTVPGVQSVENDLTVK